MRSPIWLRIAGVDQRVWSFPLSRDVLLIGRHPSCDLKIPDDHASRYHARIEHGKLSWHIIDQESTNGTFLNGQRIKEAAFKIGDALRIGHTTMIVTEGSEQGPVLVPDREDWTPLDHGSDCTIMLAADRKLTDKQTEVLAFLREGLSQKQIAHRLHVSKDTVHTHVERIYQAFNVHSQLELMARIQRASVDGDTGRR